MLPIAGVENQIDPILRPFPDAHGQEPSSDFFVLQRELLRQDLDEALGGGGGFADVGMIAEVRAFERSDRCAEGGLDFVEVEGVALLVECVGADAY